MNRDSADRVINVELVVKEPYAEYYEQTGYKTDYYRAERVGNVAGSGDRNQTVK